MHGIFGRGVESMGNISSGHTVPSFNPVIWQKEKVGVMHATGRIIYSGETDRNPNMN